MKSLGFEQATGHLSLPVGAGMRHQAAAAAAAWVWHIGLPVARTEHGVYNCTQGEDLIIDGFLHRILSPQACKFYTTKKEKVMKYISAGVALAGLMVAGSVMAADMPDLAKKNGCSACHSIDRKMVGPAWMDVSKKYKGQAGAEAKLIAKVSKGGSGSWGAMAMPPMDAAGKKQGEIKELVDYILALAK